jgi:hypothetical protein
MVVVLCLSAIVHNALLLVGLMVQFVVRRALAESGAVG